MSIMIASQRHALDFQTAQDCMSTKFGIFAIAEWKTVSQEKILSILSTQAHTA